MEEGSGCEGRRGGTSGGRSRNFGRSTAGGKAVLSRRCWGGPRSFSPPVMEREVGSSSETRSTSSSSTRRRRLSSLRAGYQSSRARNLSSCVFLSFLRRFRTHALLRQAGDHLQLPPTIKSLNNGGRRDKKTRTKPAANGVEILKTKLVEARIPPSSPSPDPSTPAADELSSPPSPAQTSTPPSAEVTPTATPSTSSLRPSPTLELTLFSRLLELHGPTIRKMLKTQYRFNSKIQEFPSQALYGGELVADESVCGRKLSDLEGVDEDEDLDEPVVFIDSE